MSSGVSSLTASWHWTVGAIRATGVDADLLASRQEALRQRMARHEQGHP